MTDQSYNLEIIPLGASAAQIKQILASSTINVGTRLNQSNILFPESNTNILLGDKDFLNVERLNNSSYQLGSNQTHNAVAPKDIPLQISQMGNKQTQSFQQRATDININIINESSNKYLDGSQQTSTIQESPRPRNLSPHFKDMLSYNQPIQSDNNSQNYIHQLASQYQLEAAAQSQATHQQGVIISPTEQSRSDLEPAQNNSKQNQPILKSQPDNNKSTNQPDVQLVGNETDSNKQRTGACKKQSIVSYQITKDQASQAMIPEPCTSQRNEHSFVDTHLEDQLTLSQPDSLQTQLKSLDVYHIQQADLSQPVIPPRKLAQDIKLIMIDDSHCQQVSKLNLANVKNQCFSSPVSKLNQTQSHFVR